MNRLYLLLAVAMNRLYVLLLGVVVVAAGCGPHEPPVGVAPEPRDDRCECGTDAGECTCPAAEFGVADCDCGPPH